MFAFLPCSDREDGCFLFALRSSFDPAGYFSVRVLGVLGSDG